MSEETQDVDPADVAAAVPEPVLQAAGRVEVAAEWVERAFGSLLAAHHEVGRAQRHLLDAAQALVDAGREDLAQRARETAALDAVEGRWTYQIVDEFRTHLLAHVRDLDATVRDELTHGVRHCREAASKRRMRGSTSSTVVHGPGEPGA